MMGYVVIITNKNSPHFDKKGVIMYESQSGNSYWIRNLEERNIFDRFEYSQKGKVRATKPLHERFLVNKKSVRKTGKKAKTLTNEWQCEAMTLLKENLGLTRKQIQKKYK